jgi:hypothetical protein
MEEREGWTEGGREERRGRGGVQHRRKRQRRTRFLLALKQRLSTHTHTMCRHGPLERDRAPLRVAAHLGGGVAAHVDDARGLERQELVQKLGAAPSTGRVDDQHLRRARGWSAERGCGWEERERVERSYGSACTVRRRPYRGRGVKRHALKNVFGSARHEGAVRDSETEARAREAKTPAAEERQGYSCRMKIERVTIQK